MLGNDIAEKTHESDDVAFAQIVLTDEHSQTRLHRQPEMLKRQKALYLDLVEKHAPSCPVPGDPSQHSPSFHEVAMT